MSATTETKSDNGLLRSIAIFLFCAVLGSYLCQLISEPSFFFHLTVGNWIRSHGFLPQQDVWFKLTAGEERLALSWLFDLCVSTIESSFGWQGLAVCKLSLCIFVVYTVFSALFALISDSFVALVITTIVSCGLLESVPFGPELVVWALLSLLLRSGIRPTSIATTALLGLLLGNIQTEWFLAAFVLFSLFFPQRRIQRLVFVLSGFCSPYLGRHVSFAMANIFAKLKFGMQTGEFAATIFDFRFCFLLFLWVFFALLTSGKALPKAKIRMMIVAGLLSLLALVFSALLPLAILAAGFVLGNAWTDCQDSRPIVISLKILGERLSRVPLPGVIWVFFCLIVVNSVNFYRFPKVEVFLPVKQVDKILDESLPSPIWHESSIGPYLAYRFAGMLGEPMRLAYDDPQAILKHAEALEVEQGSRGEFLSALSVAKTFLVRRNSFHYDVLKSQREFEQIDLGGNPAELESKLSHAWVLFVRQIELKPEL